MKKSITSLENGSLENTFLVKGYNTLISPWFKPMVNKPNFLFLLAFFALLCVYLIFLAVTFSPSIDRNYEWLTRVFSSDKYIMTLLPFLLGIASVIEKNNTPTIIIRCKSRMHQLFFTLFQQYFAGFVLITVWFIAACIFSKFMLGSIIQSHLSELIPTFLFFFLYYATMVNVATFLNRTGLKMLKRGSYAILYVASILAMIYLPRIHFIRTHNNVSFTDYFLGLILPCVVIVIFTFLLKRISSKGDLY